MWPEINKDTVLFCSVLIGNRELVALLHLSSWCLAVVERLFLAVPWGCLRFVIVVFPDHTHLLFFTYLKLIFTKLKTAIRCSHDCFAFTHMAVVRCAWKVAIVRTS